jgi:hypothetical protein
MRKLKVILVAVVLVSFSTALAQTKSNTPPLLRKDGAPQTVAQSKASSDTADNGTAMLPVRRVVLYKNGVGYFEHSGKVRGNQELSIEFTTAQLNDVLKSLTAVDLGGGQISGVRYNSIAPLSERLKTLQIGLGENVSSAGFLDALRGTRVEVRSGGATAIGKVLSVETVKRETAKGGTMDVTQLSIVSDAGELRSFEMGTGTSVRIVDGEIRQDVGRYLGLVGSARSKDVRRMTISDAGTGERQVFVSYISEVPVWKSTYRIVIPKAPGTPFLQGWAIIDNTVGEDWKDVQLSLVSGAPQSFIQNISQPYYTRRPVIALPESVTLTPQEHEASMEEGKQLDRLEQYSKLQAPPPPPPAVADTGEVSQVITAAQIGDLASNGKSAYEQMGLARKADRFVPNSSMNTAVTAAMRSQESGAEAAKLGELFEYALKQKITVLKNQSALVPIVQSPIEAERVTLVTADADGNINGAPLRALWLRNTSGLMLDGGTFNILEDDAFAGEGIMDVLHPDERRLLSYAADTALHVKATQGYESGIVTHARINRGLFQVTREQRSTRTYEVHNADATAREVVIEHPIRNNFTLTSEVKPEESSTNYHRFKIKVDPKKTETLVVKEVRPDLTQVYLTNLTDDQIAYFVSEAKLKPEVEQALRKIVAKKAEIAAVDSDISQRQRELGEIDRDQARVRENMKSLKGSAEEKALLQRYTRQLDQQEDRIGALRGEIKNLQTKRTGLQTELDQMVQNLDLDETA